MSQQGTHTPSIHAPSQPPQVDTQTQLSSVIIQTLKPDPFTGKTGISVEAWLIKVEHYLSVLQVNDEVAILPVSTLFKDYADVW